MKFKKIFYAITAVLLLASATACKKDDGSENTTERPPVSIQTKPYIPGEIDLTIGDLQTVSQKIVDVVKLDGESKQLSVDEFATLVSKETGSEFDTSAITGAMILMGKGENPDILAIFEYKNTEKDILIPASISAKHSSEHLRKYGDSIAKKYTGEAAEKTKDYVLEGQNSSTPRVVFAMTLSNETIMKKIGR